MKAPSKKKELQKEQDLNLKLFSELHNPENKFRDHSPARQDSLVQSQARELSLQRQQIKDSHDICHLPSTQEHHDQDI